MTSILRTTSSRLHPAGRPQAMLRRPLTSATIASVILSIVVMAGCSSEPEETIVVEPPETERADTAAPAPVSDTEPEPANEQPTAENSEAFERGIDLPEGEIPDADMEDDSETSEPSGGIEFPSDAKVPDAEASSDADAGAAAATVAIQYASWKQIEEKAKSTGKVTVVDLWSLSCEPCLKEFPGLVELQESMRDSAEFISVNIDYDGRQTRPPEYYEDRIRSFLDGVEAGRISNYVSQSPADDIYAAADLVSIPAVLVFDAEGNLTKKFVDAGPSAGFTYEEDIEPLVRKLAG